jgi:hypothetical protein
MADDEIPDNIVTIGSKLKCPREQFKRFHEAAKDLAKAPKTKLGAGGIRRRRQIKPA